LAVEKVLQHVVVTGALLADVGGMRDAVAVDHRWLVVVGGAVGVGYLFASAGLVRRARWSVPALTALALVDIVGEFVAQGTFAIQITLSFVVALLVLAFTRIAGPAGDG
jgi:hypothetical protein